MSRITITRLAKIEPNDRIISIGSIDHSHKPLVAQDYLAPITPGSPVQGVRCGTLAGGVEMVLYPSQCDGQQIVVDRD